MPCSGEGAEGKKRRRGRPTKYRPEYAAQAYDLSKLGTIDEALADHFDVDVTTISKWKRDYPEFSQALKRGKAVADNEVAPALLSRALGAEYVERQAFKLREVKYVNGKRVRETGAYRGGGSAAKAPARRDRLHILAQEPPAGELERQARGPARWQGRGTDRHPSGT